MKKRLIILGIILFLTVFAGSAYAEEYKYYITPDDTLIYIDPAQTTAKVDTGLYEISLPKQPPTKAITFSGEGFDYIAMTPTEILHYSFDGNEMVENTILTVSGLSNPIAIAPGIYPDVVVADAEKVTHYTLSGGMTPNPALSINGLSNIISIGARGNDKAILRDDKLEYHMSTGSGMVEVPVMSISELSNPIDIALDTNSYDCIVLESNQAKYYNFTGSELIANPMLTITGLNNPKSIAMDNGNVAIVDGNTVKQYVINGSSLVYSSALSVTTDLNKPTSVAIRPGTHDLLIADGHDIKYYMYDGTQMVYNAALSVQIAEVASTNMYQKNAIAQSLPIDLSNPASLIRLRAYHELPPQTKVTWYITIDDAEWFPCLRVSGTPEGSISEVTKDGGATWTVLGNAGQVNPLSNNPDLWIPVAEAEQVKWRAVLETADTNVTPKIKAPNPGVDPAVVLDINQRPEPPELALPTGCYLTTTPKIEWGYRDNDGDMQSAYQVVIKKPDGTVIHNTGKVLSSNEYYEMITSTNPAQPGPLWASGTNEFLLEVKVWDAFGQESDWATGDFCILALERLRVKDIVLAPDGQIIPDPANPATHLMINPGATINSLPLAKAGTKVTVLVDAVSNGYSLNADFPYLATTAILQGPPVCVATSGSNRRYEVTFWTEASTKEVPEGTVVKTRMYDSSGAALQTPPYADGVVVISDSMYSEWLVVLQGREL